MSTQGLAEAIYNLDEQTALRLSREMLDNAVDPVDILEESRAGMSVVGERFQSGEYFLSEMIMAAEIFTAIMDSIKPRMKRSVSGTIGKVVIGTVQGDVHDIGKNIIVALLEAEGFHVVDLGVDVPPEGFVEAIREHEPDIVGGPPTSLFMAGTPAKIDEYVKELLVDLKPGGGYIMSPDVSIPYTAKPENVKALADAVKKYGVY